MTKSLPETSIIIRAFNEERFLPALLKAIHAQHYQDFEIIVVDSGSYDRTANIAREQGAHLISFDCRDFTFGYSLNVGIRAAQGQFIAIASAHTEPTDGNWLSSLVEPLRQPNVAMVFGRQLGTARSKFSEQLDLLRTFGTERQALIPPNFFANNANSAVRRDLWQQRMFDQALPGLEDAEWAKHWMERGFQVVYEPKAAVYHIHVESWSQIKRRYYREALAARSMGIKGPINIVPELAEEALYLIQDVLRAGHTGRLQKRAREIVLFRFHKSLGNILGLLDGRALLDPGKRDAMYFDRTCKAVVFHGSNQASLDEVGIPDVKPSEVLIEVAYEGVCRTDLEVLAGTLGYFKSGLARWPIIPGHEFSGRVVRTGVNVHDLRQGDPVVVESIQSCGACAQCSRSNWIGCDQRKEMGVFGRNGGYCEYVVAPARFVHQLPPNLDLKRAVLCEPTAVVLKGLKRINWALAGSETKPACAVVGAGPIGHLCARILALRGFEVTSFDLDSHRLVHFEGSSIKRGDDLYRLNQFDVVIEATGDPDALHSILEHSKVGATLLLLGLPYSRREFSFESIVAYDRAIVGSVGSSAAEYEEALQILPQLPLDAFLQHIVSLDRYTEAWTAFRERKYLKTILKVRG